MVRPTSLRIVVVCLALVSGPSIAAHETTRFSARTEGRAGSAATDQVERSVVARMDETDARETRNRLVTILRQYPPTRVQVLRADPSLLRNDAYLAPYPGLARFLEQHPEIAHNPAYFVGDPGVFHEDNLLVMKRRSLDQALAG